VAAIFLTDVLVTAGAAWLVVCASGHGRHGFLEAGVAWLWSLLALVAGAGVVLGIIGGFGAGGFLLLHSVVLAGLLAVRRKEWTNDRETLRRVVDGVRRFFATPGPERLIAAGLLVILALLAAIAACAQPAVLDALTYHLPRIGAWLQEGKVRVLPTADARLNFVADIPDLVWAWFAGASATGFRLVVLAQALAGILAVGATVGLARQSGLGRSASLLAGGLLCGMANVVVQFTAAQTDLFATGVFAAAFYLWLVALRRGRCSWLGALGAGFALGAKGTLFYLAPGALLWVGWLAWHHRLAWSQWRLTLLAGLLGIGLFAVPSYLRNWQAYGGFLGPAAWVKKHHQGVDSPAGQLHKMEWNLTASLAQELEPHSQPEPLRAISRATAERLVQTLPAAADDPYTLDALDRRATLERIIERSEPDADAVSFGAVTLLLFLLGTFFCVIGQRRDGAPLIAIWAAGAVIFVLFFHFMQQWHQYAVRYLVLTGPWVAVVAAWGLEQLGSWRRAAWLLVGLATLDVGWHITTHTHQAGWKSVVSPERSLSYFASQNWRAWSSQLDHPGAPFRLALSGERPLGAFFRQSPPREVVFDSPPPDGTATAEQLLRGKSGWLIVPAGSLLGREGRVAASVWLFEGNENNPLSLAAYRNLEPGEQPSPILYRHTSTSTSGLVVHSLLVKTSGSAVAHLALANAGTRARGYQWSTPLGHARGVVPAGGRVVLELPMPADAVGEIAVAFDPADAAERDSPAPTVEFSR
jgi:hypothetical protein